MFFLFVCFIIIIIIKTRNNVQSHIQNFLCHISTWNIFLQLSYKLLKIYHKKMCDNSLVITLDAITRML